VQFVCIAISQFRCDYPGGFGLLGLGGLATVGVVTTKVDDSHEAAEERQKAQKEKERIEAHTRAKQQQEEEISNRIKEYDTEVGNEILRRIHVFSNIPLQILTNPMYIETLNDVDRLCLKLLFDHLKQQEDQSFDDDKKTNEDMSNLVKGGLLVGLALLGISAFDG
jgi:hypothetical protein